MAGNANHSDGRLARGVAEHIETSLGLLVLYREQHHLDCLGLVGTDVCSDCDAVGFVRDQHQRCEKESKQKLRRKRMIRNSASDSASSMNIVILSFCVAQRRHRTRQSSDLLTTKLGFRPLSSLGERNTVCDGADGKQDEGNHTVVRRGA